MKQLRLTGGYIDTERIKELKIRITQCEHQIRELITALKIIGKLTKKEANAKITYLLNKKDKMVAVLETLTYG